MLTVVGWTFALYAALKLCHLVLGRKVGPGREPIPLGTRMRAGEPALLIGTVTVAAALVAYTSWWSHKFHAAHYAHAVTCYPRRAAAPFLPGGRARFGSYNAAEVVRMIHQSAEEHGAALGLDEAAIDRSLEQARLDHVRRYTALAAGHDPHALAAAFAELNRCMGGHFVARGEFLHPV